MIPILQAQVLYTPKSLEHDSGYPGQGELGMLFSRFSLICVSLLSSAMNMLFFYEKTSMKGFNSLENSPCSDSRQALGTYSLAMRVGEDK